MKARPFFAPGATGGSERDPSGPNIPRLHVENIRL